jgi:transposase
MFAEPRTLAAGDSALRYRQIPYVKYDHPVWDHSLFAKNRDRLLEHEVVEAFFTGVMSLAYREGLLSREHFSVDGTLIQASELPAEGRPG